MERCQPVFLVVMDGIGENESSFGNAVLNANTPNLKWFKQNGLFCKLKAHGKAVGLPSDGDMGNSEVGHNALGAGQVYEQGAKLVQNAIASGAIFKSSVWQSCVQGIGQNALHFIGLLSDGNVHSHQDHLHAMIQKAKQDGVSRVFVHALLDGRDVSEKSAEIYEARLTTLFSQLNDESFKASVASGGGRMRVTMDRYDADWAIVERGYNAHVHGKADHYFESLSEAISEFRKNRDLTDQNFPAFVIKGKSGPVGPIVNGDRVIFFNFRGDRAIEISRSFTEAGLDKFDRGARPDVFYAGMMQYDGDLKLPENYLVGPPKITGTMGEYLAERKLRQFACSETQKFGHVTYFWNGNRSSKFDEKYETYVEIPSDRVEFCERPWMKADELTRESIRQIESHSFDFARINFANGDMVGHTGDYDASVVAVETVDLMLGRIAKSCLAAGVTLIVTADHGNADEMFDAKESECPIWRDVPIEDRPKPKTSHTLNEVPFIIMPPPAISKQLKWAEVSSPGLGNVAATCLRLMGQDVPSQLLPSLIK